MESYQAFLQRIRSFECRELSLGDGGFLPRASLTDKVGEDDRFRPFYGDTVVFDLADPEKAQIRRMVEALYAAVPEAFCEQLGDSTFHMTLHDLSNSPDPYAVAAPMERNEQTLRTLLQAAPISAQTIRMQGQAVFNMVHTSLVLGLFPENDEAYRKLMALYELVDPVQSLPYPLTPHITLAYYSSRGFDASAVKRLEAAVNRLNCELPALTLDTRRLVYQHFTDMNHYQTVWHLF